MTNFPEPSSTTSSSGNISMFVPKQTTTIEELHTEAVERYDYLTKELEKSVNQKLELMGYISVLREEIKVAKRLISAYEGRSSK